MTTPPETHRLENGTCVGGRFVVEGIVGEGGMGSVYAARDLVIERRVALKVLHLGSRRASERFRVEAAAASRVSSRFVSAIHDFGRDEALGCEYLVMELLDGQPLDAILATEGPLTVRMAAAIGADIAEALAAAHAAEVVHRDLKPGNVLVLTEGGVKVIDFGIARLTAPDARPVRSEHTNPEIILGTPIYISPEAVEGTTIGPGADLYALGVILFEMVAGRPPFYDPVSSALCALHLREPPPRIADVRPDALLPEAYEVLIQALLEKDPARRPVSASEVAEILRGMGGDTTSLRLSRYEAAPEARTSEVSRSEVPRPSRRTPLLVAIGIAALTALLLAATLLTVARLQPTPPRETAEVVLPRVPDPPPLPPLRGEDPSPVAPRTVEIPVALAPAHATLTLDGVEVRSPITLPDDATEHALVASAPGHRSETRALRGDRDRSVAITLRRLLPRNRQLPAKLREW